MNNIQHNQFEPDAAAADAAPEQERFAELMEGAVLVEFQIPAADIVPDSGRAYVYNFKSFAAKLFGRLAKDGEFRFYENGNELPLGHQLHDDIRNQGSGRHSVWKYSVYFSSSDNSDPRTNGRTYSFLAPAFVQFIEKMPTSGIARFSL
jgi:hypothetical protein